MIDYRKPNAVACELIWILSHHFPRWVAREIIHNPLPGVIVGQFGWDHNSKRIIKLNPWWYQWGGRFYYQ
jgi:hypothetical protein